MISLKEYAKQNNITYEAVRAQVKRYREQLDDHITQDGRQMLLDDVAVAFLDDRRKKNPVVIYQTDKDKTIERLKEENQILLAKLAAKGETVEKLLQYKLEAEENRRALEDAKAAQERRERELKLREDGFAQEIEVARQEAAEAARKAVEDAAAARLALAAKEADKRFQEAQAAAQAEQSRLEADLAAERQKNQALEARTFWDFLRELLFGKGEGTK